MRSEKSGQVLLALEFVFVESIHFAAIRRLDDRVTAQNPVRAQPAHKFTHQFVDLSLCEVFNRCVPNDVVKGAGWQSLANIFLKIGYVAR